MYSIWSGLKTQNIHSFIEAYKNFILDFLVSAHPSYTEKTTSEKNVDQFLKVEQSQLTSTLWRFNVLKR